VREGTLRQNSVIYHREGWKVRGRSFAPNEARKAVFADDIPMKVSASARQKLDSNSSVNSFGGGPGERIWRIAV